jgi:hypothetical protein
LTGRAELGHPDECVLAVLIHLKTDRRSTAAATAPPQGKRKMRNEKRKNEL